MEEAGVLPPAPKDPSRSWRRTSGQGSVWL